MSETYTYYDAFQTSVGYFGGDELAAKVFVDKYAMRDNEEHLLECSPTHMHRRLAREFARIEKKYPNPMSEDEIFSLLDKFKYVIPQGSPMAAIGNTYHIQSSGNCFAIEPPFDSYGGIFYTDQQLVQLMKRRGGVGLSLSTLRPKGVVVKNAARTTDGIAVFMQRYSNTCREVAQNGRRGAGILLLSIHHPEIRTFINIKQDKTKVTGTGISVKVTDEFMTAVEAGDDFELRWPVDSKSPPISQMVSAKELWDNIIKSAWLSAEPGVLFWDTIIQNSVSNCYGVVDPAFYDTACNPCGEIVMGSDSCRLLVLNLYSFVINKFKSGAKFDFSKFTEVVQKAQRLMDDMVDLEIELIEKILEKVESDPEPDYIKAIEKRTWENLIQTCKKGRRTGLGITGLGDTLAALGIRYGSPKSIKTTESIYRSLCIAAYKTTCVLAKERGAFPMFSHSIERENIFIGRVLAADLDICKLYGKYGRRNIALTTTSPAGSVSILAQVTSGIECAFSLDYKRRKKVNPDDENVRVDYVDDTGDSWQEFGVCHHAFADWMVVTGKTNPEDSPYYKATSSDIDWVSSVDIQAAAQKWVCHAISKTCNLPNDATEDLVSQVYMRAWKKDCKGFTIYREGSRSGVLVDDRKGYLHITKTNAPKRPQIMRCAVFHVSVKRIPFFVVVGTLNTEPYEIFAGVNVSSEGDTIIARSVSEGRIRKERRGVYALIGIADDGVVLPNISKHVDAEQETITRLISSNLRHGCDVNFVVHQLEKTKGDLMGFSKAVSRVLKKYISDGVRVSGAECPICAGELRRQEGCIACIACGYSRCN